MRGSAPQLTTKPSRMQRGVGYCTTSNCSREYKANFLLGPTAAFRCLECRTDGLFVPETFDYKRGQPYRQVRVEYDYDPALCKYRGLAIVTDESIPEDRGGVHTFRSPLFKTSKRALDAAALRLSNLRAGLEPGGLLVLLDFDAPIEEFRAKLRAWESRLVASDDSSS